MDIGVPSGLEPVPVAPALRHLHSTGLLTLVLERIHCSHR